MNPVSLDAYIRDFDFMAMFEGNDWNPFYYYAEWATNSIYFRGASWGASSAPDDVWAQIFGAELY